jgi:hypothetical protein
MTNRVLHGWDWFPSGQNQAVRERLWGAAGMYPFGYCQTVALDVEPGTYGFGKALLFNFGVGGFAPLLSGYIIPTDVTVSDGFIGFSMILYSDSDDQQAPIVGVYDSTDAVCQFCISFEQNGIISVWRGAKPTGSSTTGRLVSSKLGSFQENQRFHVEFYGAVDNTSGEVEVRINTVTVISLVAADTQASSVATFDALMIAASQTAASGERTHCAIDDFFFNDTDGTENNDWTGNSRIKTQFMAAPGSHTGMSIGGTSPAASNWQSVLNTLIDDTKYAFTPTSGVYDLYQPEATINSPLVHVLQVTMGARQDDATQVVARPVIKLSGTEYRGSDHYINQTGTLYRDRWELNPHTGVSFTGAEVNGAEVGPENHS